jgi:hypothetical protein
MQPLVMRTLNCKPQPLGDAAQLPNRVSLQVCIRDLVDRNGNSVKRFAPSDVPLSPVGARDRRAAGTGACRVLVATVSAVYVLMRCIGRPRTMSQGSHTTCNHLSGAALLGRRCHRPDRDCSVVLQHTLLRTLGAAHVARSPSKRGGPRGRQEVACHQHAGLLRRGSARVQQRQRATRAGGVAHGNGGGAQGAGGGAHGAGMSGRGGSVFGSELSQC